MESETDYDIVVIDYLPANTILQRGTIVFIDPLTLHQWAGTND